jgi:hypothetical protein
MTCNVFVLFVWNNHLHSTATTTTTTKVKTIMLVGALKENNHFVLCGGERGTFGPVGSRQIDLGVTTMPKYFDVALCK